MNKFLLRLQSTKQKLLFGQTLALIAGNFVGWREVISEINYYCDANDVGIGGLLSFSGTITTNPILTPCFWGTLAFVAALVWSTMIFWKDDEKFKSKQENNLFILLVGSVIFAWVNTAYTFYKYYTDTSGTDYFGCPAYKLENPWLSACFMGATAFLVAMIFAIYIKKQNKQFKDNKPTDEKD